MPRYNQGAIVLEQESPFTEFLNGIGQGVSMGVKNRLAKADEKKRLSQQVMFAAMKNELDPSLLGSADAQSFFEKAGIFDDPDIQGLVARARQSLPKEMTEAPPVAGSEYAQSTPLVQGQSPVVGEESSGTVRPGELPPGLAAMPTPQITPTAKAVHEYLQGKADKRRLAYEAEQGKQQQFRSLDNALTLRRFDLGKVQTIPEQIKEKMGLLAQYGYVLGRDATIGISGKNQVSVSLHPQDPEKVRDKEEEKLIRVDTSASKYVTYRISHVSRLQDILSKDQVLSESLAFDESDDPQVRALIMAAAAAVNSTAKTPEKKVGEIVDRVEASIKVINESFETYNSEIESVAKSAGLSPDKLAEKLIKKITFEDVSGGLTPDQYRAKKNPPKADKLISEIRNDYRPSSIQAGLPGSKSSSTESNKIKSAYDGIREVVQAALADRPGLTSEEVKSNIIGMKDSIMAEYGLSERGFSLLMAMANKVMG